MMSMRLFHILETNRKEIDKHEFLDQNATQYICMYLYFLHAIGSFLT